MTTALSLPMPATNNPLPKRYRVRVLVLRADGREFTPDDEAAVRAAFPSKRKAKPAAAKPRKAAPAKAKPVASSAPKAPKRKAAKGSTR